MTPEQAAARVKHAERVKKMRADEALCARDFLTWGDTRGAHAEFCIFPDKGQAACSRDYWPGPPLEDESLYEGTGIGALFGLEGSEKHAWQLAGWNLTTQEFDPVPEPPTGRKA